MTQYLEFYKFLEDSQVFWGVPACQMAGRNPKYWVTAMSGGIFFEIWPFEKGHGLVKHPYEG